MPAAEDDAITSEKGQTRTVGGSTEQGDLTKLDQIVTKTERLDEPRAQESEPDEFGLPARPSRRREYSVSLGDLQTPDEIAQQIIDEAKTAQEHDQTETPAPKQQDDASTIPQALDAVESDEFATPRSSLDKDAGPSTSSPVSTRSLRSGSNAAFRHKHGKSSVNTISEWSHQQMAPQPDIKEEKEEEADDQGEWQEMPALATHRIYDDWGKVLAKEYGEVDDEKVAYGQLGGAGKGYTRVQVDEDAQSATSMDENTAYLFKEPVSNALGEDEDEEARDLTSQMQATKEILTEGQRIAYVGIVRLSLVGMAQDLAKLEGTKAAKKTLEFAIEAHKMWSQKIMVRLYTHMEIDAREQIMVEQLAEHGVIPSDLTPTLMQNARIKNPNAPDPSAEKVPSASGTASPARASNEESVGHNTSPKLSAPTTPSSEALPAYEQQSADQLTIQDPVELEDSKNIDLDLRWTVLCDLFLLLIADSTYDARARTLLERVGESLSVPWQELCRFEKRVTDALEVQEQAEKENWNEDDHLEARRKAALRKRYVVMGLCTVGGGLIIGLSSGLLAPVIGAGLAAGFTGIGVAGTGTFLGGAGAAALIGTTGTLIGGRVGLKTSNRRTGAVKTFEYKPLYNNKRVNLIVTVAGWMTGKVDDVRLPFSTVDPIMGDIYSLNWEPEMLQSTGATIQILATEALTSTIQQILGATMLAGLMAGISPPIVLLKIAYLVDNPWTVSLARADATGLILADSLIDRNLGVRPITLVGFSLGARVIFSCLRELARRGALGLVQNVYVFGAPVVAKKDEWVRARSIVSGRFVNGYATNDWILGYLFRATSGGISRVAGLSSVEVAGIENKNITEWVPGHMAYRGMMPILLDQVGWTVESLEFTEIEDPDPDNHEKRQRELLNEIEEARKNIDAQPEKKGFKAFFSRKKAPQKKAWETYDERSTRVLEGDEKESERMAEENQNVLFDVDAIRREALALAIQNPSEISDIKKHLSVREIESTLPALKISTARPETSPTEASPAAIRPDLRQTQSHGVKSALALESSPISPVFPESANGEIRGNSLYNSRQRSSNSLNPETTRAIAAPPATLSAPQRSASYHLGPPEADAPGLPPSRDASRSPGTGFRSVSSPAPQGTAYGQTPVPSHRPQYDDLDENEAGFGQEGEVEMSFE